MTQRILPFDGVENFRDFGDYGAGRGRLRKGFLYRSAHHAHATEADLEAMAGLGLRTIVDLRRVNERQRDPSRRWTGFDAEVIDNDIGESTEDPWMEFIRTSDLTAESFRGHAHEFYERAPYEQRHIDLYARYFAALARAEGPLLIQCAAGKDRTGILAALTHHLAGVADDDLIADYLLTNDSARIEARAPHVARLIAEVAGHAPSDQAVRVAMGVEARYLEIALAAMAATSGSVDAYIETVLGVDGAMRSSIEARLLA